MEVKIKREDTEYILVNQYKLQYFHLRLQIIHTLKRYSILNSYCKVHNGCAEESTDLRYTHQILDACP